ncbi:MAG: LacI family DNA-binding transcriptional regulator, partial [Alphaproteobacteria bacterium]|nr:LacI family DNA-binding transcriptional regulator [Alphaproteobacteria bacterium]
MLKVWAKQSDIAKEAGVSLATVDRVLNKRPGVSVRTANKIWKAVEQLQQEGSALTPALKDSLKFDVVLPAGPNTFLNILEQEMRHLDEMMAHENIEIEVHRVDGFSPEILSNQLLALGDSSDGIAVMALENPLVREAVNRLSEKNVPVVTLVSNLSTENIIGYVGLNNRGAGRTAAYILNLISQNKATAETPASIALFEGSLDLAYSDHQEREFGFNDAIREYGSHINVVGKWATQDNHDEAYKQTMEVLKIHPDLNAIYCIGGGARGVGRALEDAGRGQDILFIAHEITNYTRDYLLR